MSNTFSKPGRWIAAALALLGFNAVFYNLVKDNMPAGDVRKIEGYTPIPKATLEIAETIPLQEGGRIKPLSTYAGFTMLGLHGARSMEIQGDNTKFKITPTAWLIDTLLRPQLAIKMPTFRIDNSVVLEAIGVTTRSKRDRYSYEEIEPARDKLIELAQSYETLKKSKKEAGQSEELDPSQAQTIDLAYNLRTYESLIGYFGFARYGIKLNGTGKNGAPDQRADVSALLATAPEIRSQVAASQAQGKTIDPRMENLLQQVFDSANFAKFGLIILPPANPKQPIWLSAGNAITTTLNNPESDAALAIADIKLLESLARSVTADAASFQTVVTQVRDTFAARATQRGEYLHIVREASYYRSKGFLYALILFIIGTITALAMWTAGKGKTGRMLSWLTFTSTAAGLIYCIIAIVNRCIIMQRPPVGNLYDTIIFITVSVVLISLIIEWMTRRRFALGVAPILGTLLIILSRRFELGDAKDNMDPLVAVLNSNYWLTIHVLTITMGYAAGLLSAFLSIIYLLMRGLGLDDGDKDLRRSLTRAVYGMICLTLFLSLVGTVLGGVWANDSWGRFWGWDPKENGALLIVLWTLSILHARLGGYIREWGLHFASVFTAAVVTFSWWHVNFLGVGLHNYGFTAGKNSVFVFYAVVVVVLVFGVIAMAAERSRKKAA
jgi:ABC-type transport system involved in cytochrome c biogenesis permease subunit